MVPLPRITTTATTTTTSSSTKPNSSADHKTTTTTAAGDNKGKGGGTGLREQAVRGWKKIDFFAEKRYIIGHLQPN